MLASRTFTAERELSDAGVGVACWEEFVFGSIHSQFPEDTPTRPDVGQPAAFCSFSCASDSWANAALQQCSKASQTPIIMPSSANVNPSWVFEVRFQQSLLEAKPANISVICLEGDYMWLSPNSEHFTRHSPQWCAMASKASLLNDLEKKRQELGEFR